MKMKFRGRILAALALSGLMPFSHASALIDPTRPTNGDRAGGSQKVPAATRNWVLSSTLVAPRRRVAVINGRPVSEGEFVDGARVIEIRKLKVLIQAPGRRITLRLLPETLRKHE